MKEDTGKKLDRIERKLDKLAKQVGLGVALDRAGLKQGEIVMAISDDILAKITAQTTTIDSIKALMDAFVAQGQITPAQRDAIFAAFDANSSKLDQIEDALQPAAPPA